MRSISSTGPTSWSRRSTADEQGSVLFREVASGPGYRVRQNGSVSDPLTVMSPDDHPAQSFYDGITIDQGYGYVPTRDGTTLSINVNFPIGGGPGPWPVVVDYSGYDPSAPGGPPQEALVVPGAGLCRRRREHARHGLLGRCVRLLRVPAVPRRLRRRRGRGRPAVVERRRRTGRDLVSRHQPTVRRPDPTAALARHHPALGDRRHLSQHALSRRHPQLRIRAGLGQGPSRRRQAGGAPMGAGPHRGG